MKRLIRAQKIIKQKNTGDLIYVKWDRLVVESDFFLKVSDGFGAISEEYTADKYEWWDTDLWVMIDVVKDYEIYGVSSFDYFGCISGGNKWRWTFWIGEDKILEELLK